MAADDRNDKWPASAIQRSDTDVESRPYLFRPKVNAIYDLF